MLDSGVDLPEVKRLNRIESLAAPPPQYSLSIDLRAVWRTTEFCKTRTVSTAGLTQSRERERL